MDDGLWLFTDNNYSTFKQRMDLIREIDKDEYWERVKDYANFLMVCNQKSPSYNLIRNSIIKYL